MWIKIFKTMQWLKIRMRRLGWFSFYREAVGCSCNHAKTGELIRAVCEGRSWFSTSGKGRIPVRYSFLQPTIFATLKPPPTVLPNPANQLTEPKDSLEASGCEQDLEMALLQQNISESWKAFKALRNHGCLPSKPLLNQLVKEMMVSQDVRDIKRAFAIVLLVLEKNPNSEEPILEMGTLMQFMSRLSSDNLMSPAAMIIKTMFRNGYYLPFSLCSPLLEQMAKEKTTALLGIEVFMEICRVIKNSSIIQVDPSVKSDTRAVNAAMNACLTLGSVGQAEELLEMLDGLKLRADGRTFGLLAQIYAKVGNKEKIPKLREVMRCSKIVPDRQFYSGLVSGYMCLHDLESASDVVLQMLKEANEIVKQSGSDNSVSDDTVALPDGEIYYKLGEGFMEKGAIKDLARFIIKAQELECHLKNLVHTAGASLINALTTLGHLTKAHSIVDEIIAEGAKAEIGIYSSLLKAYCKEKRTAEATQIVSDAHMAGHELDVGIYDEVVDVCMATQDFKAAFSLFREMREAGNASLNTSYLTIMTGLMESRRPELMAAFLDEVAEDPRIDVGVHDWNSIIHSFCKLGRLEDARRTFKKMIFLCFEPNEQSYLSLVHGYSAVEKHFNVLLLWRELRNRTFRALEKGVKPPNLSQVLYDGFLYALVKAGFFEAAMEVVHQLQEQKIFVDKWRYKQVFLEVDKKLRSTKLRKKNFRRLQAIAAFKNWVGLTS